MTTAEALGKIFTYNNSTRQGIELTNKQLDWFKKNGTRDDKNAAALLLEKTLDVNQDGKRVPMPEPPPEPEWPAADSPFGESAEVSGPPAVIEKQAIVPHEHQSTGMAFLNPDKMPDLDNATEGMSLAAVYKEFVQAGETVRCIFCGFGSMTSQQDGGQIPLAYFQSKTEVFCNAGAALTRQLQTIHPGTPIQIKYTGKERTGGGNDVKKFEVKLLILS